MRPCIAVLVVKAVWCNNLDQVSASVAEFERDLIYERTQAGRAAARANGVHVDGRPPKYSRDQRKLAMDLLAQGNSYTQVERMTGISRSTLVREHRKTASPS